MDDILNYVVPALEVQSAYSYLNQTYDEEDYTAITMHMLCAFVYSYGMGDSPIM